MKQNPGKDNFLSLTRLKCLPRTRANQTSISMLYNSKSFLPSTSRSPYLEPNGGYLKLYLFTTCTRWYDRSQRSFPLLASYHACNALCCVWKQFLPSYISGTTKRPVLTHNGPEKMAQMRCCKC